MSAAERIEWSSEHPASLWSLHPCEDIWDQYDAESSEPANDNGQRFVALAKTFPEQPIEAATNKDITFPRTREAAGRVRSEGEAGPPAGRSPRTGTGRGLTPYRFTGKEEDVEVGLQYFGKRYLNPLLGRWISADPLAVHAPGEADLNVYAYVSGRVLKNIDPLGLDEGDPQGQGGGGDSDVVPSEGNVETLPEINIHVDLRDNSYLAPSEGSYNGGEGATPHASSGGAPAADSDPTPGAKGASGVDDGKTGNFECTGVACIALGVALAAAGDIAKSLTSLPTGDTPCKSAADCKERNDNATAQSILLPTGVGATRAMVKGASAMRASPKVAPHGEMASGSGKRPTASGGGTKPPGGGRGWSVGDDVYADTAKGKAPSWSTVRQRFWKNEAAVEGAVERYGAENLERMRRGLAPQRFNPDKGGVESMELSHEPIPARQGGREFVPRWPQDHAAVDPYRRPGY